MVEVGFLAGPGTRNIQNTYPVLPHELLEPCGRLIVPTVDMDTGLLAFLRK